MIEEGERKAIPDWFGAAVVSVLFLAAVGKSGMKSPGYWFLLFSLLALLGSMSSDRVIKKVCTKEHGVFFLSLTQIFISFLLLKISGGADSPLWPSFIFPLLNSVYFSKERAQYVLTILSIALIFIASYPAPFGSVGAFIYFLSKGLILVIFLFFLKHLKRNEEAEIEKITSKTARDFLTGLYSRGYLVELIKNILDKSKKSKKPFALIMIDLDNFKKLNDTKGHQMGDTVLREFGRFLKKNLRASDIPVRYGGDEFLVLLPATDEESAKIVLNKLRERLSRFTFLVQNGLGMSAGIAVYPFDGEDIDTLLKKADKRLYENKEERKKKVSLPS